MTSVSQLGKCYLLEIPTEIRLTIYEHLLWDPGYEDHVASTEEALISTHPLIFFESHRLLTSRWGEYITKQALASLEDI